MLTEPRRVAVSWATHGGLAALATGSGTHGCEPAQGCTSVVRLVAVGRRAWWEVAVLEFWHEELVVGATARVVHEELRRAIDCGHDAVDFGVREPSVAHLVSSLTSGTTEIRTGCQGADLQGRIERGHGRVVSRPHARAAGQRLQATVQVTGGHNAAAGISAVQRGDVGVGDKNTLPACYDAGQEKVGEDGCDGSKEGLGHLEPHSAESDGHADGKPDPDQAYDTPDGKPREFGKQLEDGIATGKSEHSHERVNEFQCHGIMLTEVEGQSYYQARVAALCSDRGVGWSAGVRGFRLAVVRRTWLGKQLSAITSLLG